MTKAPTRGGSARREPPPLAKPDRARLHEAALRHLARYAATEAGVVRVLDRRVMRWAQQGQDREDEAHALRPVVREVARRLVDAGVVDDTTFAAGRAASLARGGRSKRAIAAHLAARGVDADLRETVLPADDIRAAAILCRRRRLGAFGPPPPDGQATRRQAAVFARNGFSEAVARKILAMDRDAVEALARGDPTD